jgi:hypothetical protein
LTGDGTREGRFSALGFRSAKFQRRGREWQSRQKQGSEQRHLVPGDRFQTGVRNVPLPDAPGIPVPPLLAWPLEFGTPEAQGRKTALTSTILKPWQRRATAAVRASAGAAASAKATAAVGADYSSDNERGAW